MRAIPLLSWAKDCCCDDISLISVAVAAAPAVCPHGLGDEKSLCCTLRCTGLIGSAVSVLPPISASIECSSLLGDVGCAGVFINATRAASKGMGDVSANNCESCFKLDGKATASSAALN